MARKTHQTTLRFSDDMWEALEHAAAHRDVSVAQYVRDAAQARLDDEATAPDLGSDRRAQAAAAGVAHAQERALDVTEGSAALWEQGRLARKRSAALRAQSREQRLGAAGTRDQSRNAAVAPETERVARERVELLRDPARD